MLPNVTLNGATNYSSNNTKLEFAGNIAPVEQNGAQSTSNNLSVNLNYTLFDGLAMFYNYDILKASKSQTEIQTRLNIENTLLQVIAGYYEMARLQNQMKIGKEALAISKERYRRAKTYNEFGGSSKIEFLSAEVDLNTDSSAFLNAELAWVNSRRNLNFLMGVENDLIYKVEEDVTLNKDLEIENLFDKAKQNNAGVMNAEYNILISEKQLKTTKSTLLPTIAANASYGYSGSNNEVGIVLSNQNTGFNAGLSLTYPLFRGGVQSTQRQNAQIQLENATLQKELAEKQLVRDLNNAFSTYQNAIRVVELNEKNLVTAKLNFNRTKELYDLGKVTNTQFREAQLNFARTKSTLVNSSFQVKLAEADLIRISGSLLE
jgi:outer membrane protein TolC